VNALRTYLSVAFLSVALSSILAVQPAWSQEQEDRYTFEFTEQSVSSALEHVAKNTALNLIYDVQRLDGLKTICVAVDVVAQQLFDCILKGTNLQMTRLPHGTFILRSLDAEFLPQMHQKGYGSIRGAVIDRHTGEPLAGANVVLVGTSRGAATDKDGQFEIPRVRDGVYTIDASMLGYKNQRALSVQVLPDKNSTLQLALQAATLELRELIVTPGFFSLMQHQPVRSQVLSSTEIRRMPHLADDAFRSVSRLPGLASNDFSAGFTVRGGSHDEVLVLFDGMELIEPFHIKSEYGGGALSIIDTEAIDGVEMMTGAFPVAYGNRLSAVFKIDSSTPEHPRPRTSLGFSFTNARFLSEGQFDDGRGEWLLVGRRGFVDLLLNAFSTNNELDLTYYDVVGKLKYALNDRHNLALNVLTADDDVRFLNEDPGNPDRVSWKDHSAYSWLTWHAGLGSNFSVRTLLSAGTLSADRDGQFFTNGNAILYGAVNDDRAFDFLGVKQDWSYEVADRLLLNLGYEGRRYSGRYDYTKTVRTSLRLIEGQAVASFDSTLSNLHPQGWATNLYLGSRLKLSNRLVVEGGVRYDDFEWMDSPGWSPRVGLAYSLSSQSTLRLGYGRFNQSQGIHQLGVEDGDELFYPPEVAIHHLAGFEHQFNNGLLFRLEGYYKDLSDLAPYYQNLADGSIDNQRFPEVEDDRMRIIPTSGFAKGIEIFFKKENSRQIAWWASYSLSAAKNHIKEVEPVPFFNGQVVTEPVADTYVPGAFDQTHALYGDITYRPNDGWTLSMAWQYHTGWPFTQATVRPYTTEEGEQRNTLEIGPVNGARVPDYHRLDLRISRNISYTKSHLTLFLEFLNLYSRKNVRRSINLVETGPIGDIPISVENKTWAPFIPSLGLRWDLYH